MENQTFAWWVVCPISPAYHIVDCQILRHSISKKECHINEFPLCFTYNMYIVPSSVTTTTSKNPKSPRAWVVKFLMLATSLAFKVNYEDAAVPSLYNNESSSHTKLTQWSKLYIPSTVRNMLMLLQTTLWEENKGC